MSWQFFPVRLARVLLEQAPTDDDGLAVLLLLHTHHFWFRRSWDDRPGITEMCADTQRGAATVIAQAWPNQDNHARTDPVFWFDLFKAAAPFELVEDMPEAWRRRVEALRIKAAAHPDVLRVEPED